MRSKRKRVKKKKWYIWYAWRPIQLLETSSEFKGVWVWLEYVERKNLGGPCWFYRDIQRR